MSTIKSGLVVAAAAVSLFIAGCSTSGDSTPATQGSAFTTGNSCKQNVASCKGMSSCKGMHKKHHKHKRHHHKAKKVSSDTTTTTTTTSDTTAQ